MIDGVLTTWLVTLASIWLIANWGQHTRGSCALIASDAIYDYLWFVHFPNVPLPTMMSPPPPSIPFLSPLATVHNWVSFYKNRKGHARSTRISMALCTCTLHQSVKAQPGTSIEALRGCVTSDVEGKGEGGADTFGSWVLMLSLFKTSNSFLKQTVLFHLVHIWQNYGATLLISSRQSFIL